MIEKRKMVIRMALLAVAVLLPSAVWAQTEFTKGGLVFKVMSGTINVEVRQESTTSFSGDLIIPSKVTDEATNTEYDVKKVSSSGFQNNAGITKVIIPESVTQLGGSCFEGCTALKEVKIEGAAYPEGSDFRGCTNLTTVDLGSDVTAISLRMFENCTSLESVKLPAALEIFEVLSFNGCLSLTSLDFSECTKLDRLYSGIGGTKIKSLTFPYLKNIMDNAFQCLTLEKVTILQDTPPGLWNGSASFYNTPAATVFEVPANVINKYKTTGVWNTINLSALVQEGVDYTVSEDQTDVKISYSRKVNNTNWMGVCLPFDLVYSDWSAQGQAAILTEAKGETLDWTILESGAEIKAGTPFIFKPNEAGTVKFEKTSATLCSKDVCGQKAGTDFTLFGTFETVSTMYSDDLYALSQNAFRQAHDDSQTLKPYRVYIKANSPAKAPAQIRCRINGVDATGIDGVEFLPQSDGKARNLQGIEVGADYKGIVIQNGKKVMRK